MERVALIAKVLKASASHTGLLTEIRIRDQFVKRNAASLRRCGHVVLGAVEGAPSAVTQASSGVGAPSVRAEDQGRYRTQRVIAQGSRTTAALCITAAGAVLRLRGKGNYDARPRQTTAPFRARGGSFFRFVFGICA